MKAAIIVVVLGLAGFLVWQKLFSPTARTERAYLACMKEAETAGDRIKVDLAAKAPAGKASEAVAGMTGAIAQRLSGAMCGAIRAACQSDFSGGACQGALDRYK